MFWKARGPSEICLPMAAGEMSFYFSRNFECFIAVQPALVELTFARQFRVEETLRTPKHKHRKASEMEGLRSTHMRLLASLLEMLAVMAQIEQTMRISSPWMVEYHSLLAELASYSKG